MEVCNPQGFVVPVILLNSSRQENAIKDGREAPPTSKDTTFQERALDEFRGLIKFLETYLASELRIFTDIQEGRCTTIPFHRLWMLFRVGTTIYSPSKKAGQKYQMSHASHEDFETKSRPGPQAYRVLNARGGETQESHCSKCPAPKYVP